MGAYALRSLAAVLACLAASPDPASAILPLASPCSFPKGATPPDEVVDMGDVVVQLAAVSLGTCLADGDVDGAPGMAQGDAQLCASAAVDAVPDPADADACAVLATNPHLDYGPVFTSPGGGSNFLLDATDAVEADTVSWWLTVDNAGGASTTLDFGFAGIDEGSDFGIAFVDGDGTRFLGADVRETQNAFTDGKAAPLDSSGKTTDEARAWFTLPFGPATPRVPATDAAHAADFFLVRPGTLRWDFVGGSAAPLHSRLIQNRRPIGAHGKLLVNLWFVTHSTEPHLTAAESVANAQFQTVLAAWLARYTDSGVGITEISILERRDITGRDDLFEIDTSPLTEFNEALQATAPLAGTANDGFNLVFVNRFVGSSVIGRAPLGGPPPPLHHGSDSAGGVISFQGFDLSSEVVPADELEQIGSTIAHEIGHYMKLQHPSDAVNTGGTPAPDVIAHDWLDDPVTGTPECADGPGDVATFPDGCGPAVRANLMFNVAESTATGIVADQADLIEKSPFIVNP